MIYRTFLKQFVYTDTCRRPSINLPKNRGKTRS